MEEEDLKGPEHVDDEKVIWYAEFNKQIKEMEEEVKDDSKENWFSKQEETGEEIE